MTKTEIRNLRAAAIRFQNSVNAINNGKISLKDATAAVLESRKAS